MGAFTLIFSSFTPLYLRLESLQAAHLYSTAHSQSKLICKWGIPCWARRCASYVIERTICNLVLFWRHHHNFTHLQMYMGEKKGFTIYYLQSCECALNVVLLSPEPPHDPHMLLMDIQITAVQIRLMQLTFFQTNVGFSLLEQQIRWWHFRKCRIALKQ